MVVKSIKPKDYDKTSLGFLKVKVLPPRAKNFILSSSQAQIAPVCFDDMSKVEQLVLDLRLMFTAEPGRRQLYFCRFGGNKTTEHHFFNIS